MSDYSKLKAFALKLVGNEEELESLDYWAEEYLHAYEQLGEIAEIVAENKKLKERVEQLAVIETGLKKYLKIIKFDVKHE